MRFAERANFWIPSQLFSLWGLAGLSAGLAFRIVWAVTRRVSTATGEAAYVAAALGSGHGFADAFVPGQGPTAHLLPVSPLIAGGVYRLFGVYSGTSETLLFCWSIGLVFGSYLLMGKCFELLGSSRATILAGFLAIAVLPIYTSFEVFDFRIWEGGLALFTAAMLLVLVLQADAGRPVRAYGAWLAILPALVFFINPPLGLATVAAALLFLWRRKPRAGAVRIVIGMACTLAALLGPWTIRNWRVMGEPIVLRDNAGLELAMGNFPGALDRDRPFNEIFDERMERIHPRDNPRVFQRVQLAGGEAAYARMMGAETKRWMAENPGYVARLWVKHAREMLFTRTWMFHTQHGVWMPVFRSTVVTVLALLALPGFAWGLLRDRRYLYVAPYLVVPVLCYVPFQPVERYSWLLYPLLAYAGMDFLFRLGQAIGARVRPPRLDSAAAAL